MNGSRDGDEDDRQGDGFKPRALVRKGRAGSLGANSMKSGLASALVASGPCSRTADDRRLAASIRGATA
ncbi:MAG: hypothetical protein IT529_00770 [Burkholderiales bacterium]|nr:hypothetical protein [Burkholderiales bacterium]